MAVKVLGIPDINEMFDHALLETTENSLGRAGRFRSEREAHVKSPAERQQRAQAALVSQPFTMSLL